MAMYYFNHKHSAYVKNCPRCNNNIIGTSSEVESEEIFKEHFDSDHNTLDGLYGICRPCRTLSDRARRYGPVDVIKEILRAQNGMCAICSTRITLDRGKGFRHAANVDHDHATGTIRGLLCLICNMRLSALENTEWRVKAEAYLDANRNQQSYLAKDTTRYRRC